MPRSLGQHKPWLILALKVLTLFVAVPALLALCGLGIEAAIYKPDRRPAFHLLHFALAGWIAAPIILVRWCWPWPKHLRKFELFVFILQSIGFFLAINGTILAGNDIYQSNAILRKDFNSELFGTISHEEDVWKWLESVMTYVYNRTGDSTIISRRLSGRMTMVTSIRLRQNRVKPVNCSPIYTSVGFAGAEECYPAFVAGETEDRSTYGTLGSLQFKYYNTEVNSTTGHPISMESYKISGDFGDYPLAGFWVWFSPPLQYNVSLQMLQLMQESRWIDDQTRAIGLDVGIGLLDFVEKPIWTNIHFLMEKNRAGRFIPAQPQVDINYFFQNDDIANIDPTNRYNEYADQLVFGANLNSLPNCTVGSLKRALRPMYLGALPFIVYTVTVVVIELCHNWRALLLSKPFVTIDILWAAVTAAAIGLKMGSLRYADCGSSLFSQTIFSELIDDFGEVKYSVRFEVLQLAAVWTQVRILLGVALFLHIFNFLKFLLRLQALGVLVRTLRFAAVELLSFSFSFFILFSGFVSMFYYIYSIESSDFRTVLRSVATLWLGMLGELNLTPELWRSGYLTVVLFIVFIFVSSFVLLTLIISIVSKAHEDAQKPDAFVLHPIGRQQDDDLPCGNEERLVAEMEVMMKSLKTWKSYIEVQRKLRKVAPQGTDETTEE